MPSTFTEVGSEEEEDEDDDEDEEKDEQEDEKEEEKKEEEVEEEEDANVFGLSSKATNGGRTVSAPREMARWSKWSILHTPKSRKHNTLRSISDSVSGTMSKILAKTAFWKLLSVENLCAMVTQAKKTTGRQWRKRINVEHCQCILQICWKIMTPCTTSTSRMRIFSFKVQII